jgi:hypothetical protein
MCSVVAVVLRAQRIVSRCLGVAAVIYGSHNISLRTFVGLLLITCVHSAAASYRYFEMRRESHL